MTGTATPTAGPQDTSASTGETTMQAAYLPGGSRTELHSVPIPEPGRGQVLLEVRASTICGSDLRAIYREHLGSGPEAYQGVIGGHEPCGRVVAVGEDVQATAVGDRRVVYHISGCGLCEECRRGYPIGCLSPRRAAYGWQRDGGHAEYLLAEEKDLLSLPDSLTYLDGACVACGFGTAYEALRRADVTGADTVLVVGLGPVGLATGMLARALGSTTVVGTDPSPDRRAQALELDAVDHAVEAADLPGLLGDGAHVALDCSGSGAGQSTALRSTRRWGRTVLVGEGGTLTTDVSAELIHRQITLHGSWVSSIHHMRELLENLDRWGLHPEKIVTHAFPLAQVDEAYRTADSGVGGKVAVVRSDDR
ncbi:alcohol dehydrogenase [Brachybacterium vulturis]|uniref:Alcohol dehydrogenase n=1 Tax=Brachybacterium vulturis TaxID=2017484 RepID=A0A291GPH4_9MICO|nr:zinc-binding dehydrogenase [Brachybacterium vulturis]ATG52098.1 alcohol dehydrogenase [Brachybacterium vulturis]